MSLAGIFHQLSSPGRYLGKINKLCNESAIGALKFKNYGVFGYIRQDCLLNHVPSLQEKESVF